MSYKTRLRISKWIFTAIIVLVIVMQIYFVYFMTLLNDGHLFETIESNIRAEYDLLVIVRNVIILPPLLLLLWSKQFGTDSSVRLTGYILSLIILSPWVTSLTAKAMRLPSGGLAETFSWSFWFLSITIILGIILTLKSKEA